MDPARFENAFILTGPTASGKSAVGVIVAERLRAEIISMDSMASYRGMDIGTAKPSAAERARVPHHLLDVLEPWESSSLAWWLRETDRCCEEIERRGRQVLFVGGTPLYLKALLRGIFEGPPADRALRHRLEQQPGPVLHARLSEADPTAAQRIHPNDVRRLIRALEVLETTGRPLSQWQQQFDQIRPRAQRPIWLNLPRQALYARIDRRVEQMMEGGLLNEVQRLAELPRPLSREARQALGYKELLEHLQGEVSLPESVTLIQTRSRNFAKRQLTWFRSLEECQALTITETESAAEIAERILKEWQPV